MDLDAELPHIAAGDARAFGRWAAGVEARLRASLRSFAATVDSEPIVQETLLRIWQIAPRHESDGRPDSLLRLAIRIARNLAIDELRHARAEPLADDDAPGAEPAPSDPMLRRILLVCRAGLSVKPALALDARIASAGAEPDTALAARLGMRLNTFLQNVTRARRALAECLKRHHVELAEELP